MRFGYFDSEITGVDSDGMPIFDRAESSDLFRLLLKSLISNGVLASPSCFKTTAGSGMTVQVSPGFGMIEGAFCYEAETTTLTIPAADSTYTRWDSIVLRLSYPDRQITLEVKSGAATGNPAPPAIQRDADAYELHIAEILVEAGVASIQTFNIRDTRQDSRKCGLITQMIDHLDTADWADQLEAWLVDEQAAFIAWFESMRGQLSEDAAGLLKNQIDAIAIAQPFVVSDTRIYGVNSMVYYNGRLYRCTQEHTGTAWIPANWVEVDMSDVRARDVLYSGDQTGTVTLAASAANYDELEIYFEGFNGASPQSIRVINPDGRVINTAIVEVGGTATQTRIRRTRWEISGTSIAPDITTAGYVTINSSSIAITPGANVIHITRVVGYK